MEKVQNLKHCTWISEEISVKNIQQKHSEILRSIFDCHPSKVGWQQACQSFFSSNVPDTSDDPLAADDGATKPAIESLWDIEEMEKDCGIDQLTVPNELPASDRLDDAAAIDARLPTNWFEGPFNDGVIPEGGSDRLLALYHQQAELNKRTSVGDYATLRFRTLKYFSTVRLPQEVKCSPLLTDFPEDVIINVRIQRPFFKRMHYKKSSNKFPTHAQELMLLGKQHLTVLRDAIDCVNDLAVHRDMADSPDLNLVQRYPRAKDEFPSSLFYMNGVFFVDMREDGAKDYSENLHKWVLKVPDLGEFRTKHMESSRFIDLNLRLGYPYLYLHQGYCEHLITFTDVRLREQSDPHDESNYPVSRGHASKLSVRCCTCNRDLAKWVVVDCRLFNVPRAHVCHSCLMSFCYDDKKQPVTQFSLFAFFDDGNMQLEKLRQKAARKSNTQSTNAERQAAGGHLDDVAGNDTRLVKGRADVGSVGAEDNTSKASRPRGSPKLKRTNEDDVDENSTGELNEHNMNENKTRKSKIIDDGNTVGLSRRANGDNVNTSESHVELKTTEANIAKDGDPSSERPNESATSISNQLNKSVIGEDSVHRMETADGDNMHKKSVPVARRGRRTTRLQKSSVTATSTTTVIKGNKKQKNSNKNKTMEQVPQDNECDGYKEGEFSVVLQDFFGE
uniref:snRNA-activating protein complex subunit 3 n=2 Tax=Hirondellea gigas TaxID=1518452 RepID=A0A2P2I8T3_9CRUS